VVVLNIVLSAAALARDTLVFRSHIAEPYELTSPLAKVQQLKDEGLSKDSQVQMNETTDDEFLALTGTHNSILISANSMNSCSSILNHKAACSLRCSRHTAGDLRRIFLIIPLETYRGGYMWKHPISCR
jgi:hypothetical protein